MQNVVGVHARFNFLQTEGAIEKGLGVVGELRQVLDFSSSKGESSELLGLLPNGDRVDECGVGEGSSEDVGLGLGFSVEFFEGCGGNVVDAVALC
jgi:hypothetical protein